MSVLVAVVSLNIELKSYNSYISENTDGIKEYIIPSKKNDKCLNISDNSVTCEPNANKLP